MNLRSGSRMLVLTGVVVAALGGARVFADDYVLDASHAAFVFKVSHIGLSETYGRFNDVSGEFTVDGSKSAFAVAIKTDSVDTGNAKRDEHLKSPDFFNAKQFPGISFKSTSVKAVKDGFDVAGDFTLHGVTKPIKFTLKGGKTAQFPPGVQRTGFSTELTIKRSDYGMEKMIEAIGDEVHVAISFEGTKKK